MKAEFGPIYGVVHAAGAVDDAPLLGKDPGSADAVLSPKVHGTKLLDSLLPDGSIDRLVLFSSTSTVLAPAGQTDYVAANEYLTPSLRRLLIDHTRIGMTFYNPRKLHLAPQRELAADQHDQFIALIEAADADAAASLAVAHWELSRAQIESFVTPDSIKMPLGRLPGNPKNEEPHEIRRHLHACHHAPP
ncbi:MAG: KR domain-containing protein [Aquincola sp.]|nr:KR domain-containing protein [Aquincola sp.]